MNRLVFSFLSKASLGCILACLNASAAAATVDETASNAFFASPNLATFQVELGSAEFDQLVQKPRTYVPGKVRVGGKIYEQVGVRLKGTGTFQPISQQPSLALKFNWKSKDQDFAGLTKLFLNNSGQDATRLCEFAASKMFHDGGIPVPRITQARLHLNGRDLGLYVLAEPVNKRFLKSHFHNARGNLYEGEFQDVDSNLEMDNGTPNNWADLKQLRLAAQQSDPAKRREALAQVLDLEEFLNFLAIEMIVANWDGYAYHQNNYRIYRNPESGRMAIIPHGLDNTFFESGLSLMPPRSSVLISALLETPESRDAFRKRVGAIVRKVFNVSDMQAHLRIGAARLKQNATAQEAQAIDCRLALFEQRIRERAAHLEAELNDEKPKTLEFNAEGIAKLDGWLPKPDWNHSPLEELSADGRSFFTIHATNGFCFSSWRLPVWLSPGRYRLEGVARTDGVLGLPSRTGSGAGVRVLGNSRGSGLQRSQDWTVAKHGFIVREGGEWLELVAELRAFQGSASFDSETLRLVRLK